MFKRLLSLRLRWQSMHNLLFTVYILFTVYMHDIDFYSIFMLLFAVYSKVSSWLSIGIS